MKPIVTIYIPSRKRVERLIRCLQWINDTAHPDNYEVFIWFDDDDRQSLNAIPQIESMGRIKCIVGPRRNGWASIEENFMEALPQFNGTWIWVLNDDMWIEGKGWDEQLKGVPTEGVICHPEISGNGGSVYRNDTGGCFPIVPNRFWEKLGQPQVERPYDTYCNELARTSGWKFHFLPNVTTVHARDSAEAIEAHRKS